MCNRMQHPKVKIHAVWHREVIDVKLHTFLTSVLYGDVCFVFQSPLQPEKTVVTADIINITVNTT
jgi:uncharacterized sodium:solute symporter family permease YidK